VEQLPPQYIARYRPSVWKKGEGNLGTRPNSEGRHNLHPPPYKRHFLDLSPAAAAAAAAASQMTSFSSLPARDWLRRRLSSPSRHRHDVSGDVTYELGSAYPLHGFTLTCDCLWQIRNAERSDLWNWLYRVFGAKPRQRSPATTYMWPSSAPSDRLGRISAIRRRSVSRCNSLRRDDVLASVVCDILVTQRAGNKVGLQNAMHLI